MFRCFDSLYRNRKKVNTDSDVFSSDLFSIFSSPLFTFPFNGVLMSEQAIINLRNKNKNKLYFKYIRMRTILYILLSLLAALLFCRSTDGKPVQPPKRNVTLDDTTVNGLIVYFPHFSRIDLVCGTMPSKQDTSVIFCAEAAFTHKILEEFAHSNIDGDHVSGGKRYTGAKCESNSGAFAWFGNSTWEFIYGEHSELLDRASEAGGMAFGQAIIIYNGERIQPLWRKGVNQYRALCEKDGYLCIVDSRQKVSYEHFVELLENFAPTHALYLDMGPGWNHSWWRDENGTIHEIHPATQTTHFCTNWLTFYK